MLRLIAVAIVTVLLCACAPMRINSLDTAFIRTDMGVVNLSVTSNYGNIESFSGLVLEPAAGGEEVVIRPLSLPNKLNTNLFSFQMKPGEYRLKQIRTSPEEGVGYTYCEPRDRSKYRFTVGNHQVTDLGAIAMVRVNHAACQIIRNPMNTGITDELAFTWPKYDTLIHHEENEPTLTWNDEPHAFEAVALYIATQITPSVHNPVVTQEGALLAGSELGQVLLRIPGGRWTTIHTNTLNTILFVTPLDDGVVLSGELNTFILAKDQQHTVIDSKGLPRLPIVYVDYHPRVGLMVFFQDGDTIRIFAAEDVESPQWRPYSSLTVGSTFWGYKNTFIKSMNSKVYVASTPNRLHVFDAPTGNWTEKTLPGEPLGMSVSPLNEIIVLADDGWRRYNFLSTDDGDNWEPLNKRNEHSLAHIRSDGSIIMLVGGPDPKIMRTVNRGSTWEEDRPAHDGTLFVNGEIEIIISPYNRADGGNFVWVYVEKDEQWYWERNTNYEYNRDRILKQLKERYGNGQQTNEAI